MDFATYLGMLVSYLARQLSLMADLNLGFLA